MNLVLKRVFKVPVKETNTYIVKEKCVNISKCNAHEFLDLVCTVMADEQTLRIIIEQEK